MRIEASLPAHHHELRNLMEAYLSSQNVSDASAPPNRYQNMRSAPPQLLKNPSIFRHRTSRVLFASSSCGTTESESFCGKETTAALSELLISGGLRLPAEFKKSCEQSHTVRGGCSLQRTCICRLSPASVFPGLRLCVAPAPRRRHQLTTGCAEATTGFGSSQFYKSNIF